MTKRKSEEQKAAVKAKRTRRVPLTAPKDVATKALVARNASCSPLLRMPLEIRNRIWKAVLGDRLIHLELLGPRRVCKEKETRRSCVHVVCDHDRPEHGMTEEEISWRQPHQSCSHELAYQQGYRPTQISYDLSIRKPPDPPESVHLTVLRVCRQVYNEANNVLWSTNTFSFSDADPTFVDFIESRTTQQKQMWRKLRLQMDWVYEDDKVWDRVLGAKRLRSLTGIRSLRLQINHSMEALQYRSAKASADPAPFSRLHQCEFVHKVATWPLSDVEVFISDFPDDIDVVGPLRDPSVLWTADDRAEYADGIRQILLDPQAAEKHAQLQQVMRKCRQVVKDVRKEHKAARDAELAEMGAEAEEYLRMHYPEGLE